MPIRLVPLERQDLILLARWRNDQDIVRWLFQKWPISFEEEELWYRSYLQRGDYKVLMAHDVEHDKNIGYVRFANIDFVNSCLEIGGDIGEPDYRRKGLGESMYREALSFAFDELNMNRVFLNVFVHNVVAKNLYQKLGFSKEGTLRKSVFKSGDFRDTELWSLLHNEWLQSRGQSAKD